MILKTFILFLLCSYFSEPASYSEQEVIYARRDGMALTMTVLKPEKPNGKAIISLLSGGYYSDYSLYTGYRDRALPFVEAGYTVFLTQHSSGLRYTIPDAFEDIQKAVQYVRFNAATYQIDANTIGITGTSSGGNLALLIATADDIQDTSSKDPLERMSSRVQAAAVFCPPTDWLNYGKEKYSVRNEKQLLQQLRVESCFKYTTYDVKSDSYIRMDEIQERKTDSLMSPAQLVTSDDAPTLICHGTKDDVVPFQQAVSMMGALNRKKVPAKLIEKIGAGHGWKNMNEDQKEFITWFDTYLKK